MVSRALPPQLLIAHDSTHPLFDRQQGRSRPAQGHRTAAPAFDPTGLAANAGIGRLDDIRAGQAAPQRLRQAEAVDREHLLQTFPETAGRRGILPIQPLGQLPELGDAPISLQLERRLHGRLDIGLAFLRQVAEHVTGLMDAAALNGCPCLRTGVHRGL